MTFLWKNKKSWEAQARAVLSCKMGIFKRDECFLLGDGRILVGVAVASTVLGWVLHGYIKQIQVPDAMGVWWSPVLVV